MVVRMVTALLQKLLSLCQRCGRRSLHFLLHLYSVLLRFKDADPCFPRIGDENTYVDKSADPKVPGGLPEGVHIASIEPPVVSYSEAQSSLPDAPSHAPAPRIEKVETETSILGTFQPLETVTPSEQPPHLPDKQITCTFPSGSARYDQSIVIRSKPGPWNFEPLETLNIHKDEHIPDWTPYVHPKGQLYFLNTSLTLKLRYLTEAHLYDEQIREEITQFIVAFERKSQTANLGQLPSDVEVVLQIDDGCWSYYMVDFDRRCLFWIDAVAIDESFPLFIYYVEKKEQLRHLFDSEFWEHVSLFPSHRPLLHGALEKLLGILTYSQVDAGTPGLPSSTVPFDKQGTETCLKSISCLREIQGVGGATPYAVAASANLLSQVAYKNSLDFHGFHGARLSLKQNVHGKGPRPHSWFIKLLSPVLFYSPETQLARLEEVCSDGLTRPQLWKPLQTKLERDWEGFVLYSTVLLNANVAFLAIPTVISSNNVLWISPAAVASQVSIIASLGSIITGLILIRLSPLGANSESNDATIFVNTRILGVQSGFETLAVLYSLPYSLLMWGLVTFLASVAILCFYNALGDVTTATRLVYGVVWILVTLSIGRTMLVTWEVNHKKDWGSFLPVFVLHPRNSWRRFRPLMSAFVRYPQGAWQEWRGRSTDEEVAEDGTNTEPETNKVSTYSGRSARSFRSARSQFTALELDVLPN